HIGNYAVEVTDRLANEGVEAAHYDMRYVKPLDEALLHEICKKHNYLITVEDGCLMGGFGSAILEFVAEHNYSLKIVRLGMPDAVIEHGEQIELHRECGFDPEGIYNSAIKILSPQLA
ncbi:MAG: 1-deoxy-D-xylulose-5-phosphate synthase, partial [Paraglaciecola sp.]